jgi:hypothetical protein
VVTDLGFRMGGCVVKNPVEFIIAELTAQGLVSPEKVNIGDLVTRIYWPNITRLEGAIKTFRPDRHNELSFLFPIITEVLNGD